MKTVRFSVKEDNLEDNSHWSALVYDDPLMLCEMNNEHLSNTIMDSLCKMEKRNLMRKVFRAWHEIVDDRFVDLFAKKQTIQLNYCYHVQS